MTPYEFKKAVPIWEQGKETEMNYHLAFRSIVKRAKKSILVLSASNMYQLFVNGTFVAEGPARVGHGYYVVDEIDITKYFDKEENIVTIYVDGYNIPNYYLIDQPAFLCAEIISNDTVVNATGVYGFEAKYHSDRVRKVQRYSKQRTFVEAYSYDENYKDFETKKCAAFMPVNLKNTSKKNFIVRDVPYPCYDEIKADNIIYRGQVSYKDFLENPLRNHIVVYDETSVASGKNIPFGIDEMEIINIDEYEKAVCERTDRICVSNIEYALNANTYVIYEFPKNKTGFVRLDIECSDDARLIIAFDEILTNNEISLRRINAINSIIWDLKKGNYSLISNEPYTMKYLKLINKSMKSTIKINNVSIVEFAFQYNDDGINSGNEIINRIYDAAVETFRQNTLDIYMDCPSRERAGWLCDSFFTSRVEYALTGKSLVEKRHIENFIFNDYSHNVTNGLFPMCYPSDFRNAENTIPQWSMWLVLEIEEYLIRTGDKGLVENARDRIYNLLTYLERFENEDGLLEAMEGWLFVEWSKANSFVNDVNYPTNMLYARMLRAIGKFYDVQYIEKANRIEETIRRQSYFDGFFHDHAVRNENNVLEVIKEDITETCQYYAFFTNTATKEMYPELWNVLLYEFTFDRMEKGVWKEIWPSNAFIGYYLKLDILSREKEYEKLQKNIEKFFCHMADATGTLWENKTAHASCNHGFASAVIVWIKELMGT